MFGDLPIADGLQGGFVLCEAVAEQSAFRPQSRVNIASTRALMRACRSADGRVKQKEFGG
jgi:hypothetical protein